MVRSGYEINNWVLKGPVSIYHRERMFGEDHVVFKGNRGGNSGHLQGTNEGEVPIENCLLTMGNH